MQRILKFVEGEVRGLHEAAYLLGFFALLSTLLALFRDRILASTFGAGETLDIYYAAFRIPDIVFVSVASLVSVFILIPILTSATEEGRHKIIGNVIAGFSIVMLISSVLLWFLMPTLLQSFFPTLIGDDNALLALSRILLLQPIFLGASGIVASITQINGRYLLYAIAPLLYNLGIILGIMALYPLFGLAGIAYGVVFGAFLHLGIQIPFALRKGYLARTSFKINIEQLKEIVLVSIPRTLSIASNQIALLFLVIMAAGIGAGAVSVFSLAFNLQAAPLAIIGASYSVAAFPTLARFISQGEVEHFNTQMLTAARHIIFWSIPIMSLVVVLRAHIVRVTLGSGAFDWADTRLTAAALALFIVSLTAQALSLLFVRGYYAAGETRKPLFVNVSTATGMVGGAYVLHHLFVSNDTWKFFIEALLRVEDITGTEVLMLPLSYALFSVINVLVFFTLYERDFGLLSKYVDKTILHSFSAAVVAGFFAQKTLQLLDGTLDIDTFIGVFSLGLIAGVVGTIFGVTVLWILKNKEIEEVYNAMHQKFWKRVTIFTDAGQGQ